MNTLRITSSHFKELSEIMREKDVETAVFLLAGEYSTLNGIHFVVRQILVPKNEDYDSRTINHIQVSPIFFNWAISLAEANKMTLVQCHSHPESEELHYSITDNIGEGKSSETIRECLLGKPMGSLLFGKDKIIGRIWKNSKPEPINEIKIISENYRTKQVGNLKQSHQLDETVYDRQIRAFGLKGQQLLSRLKIGIVGLGGTGSAVSEQLVREGIQNFVLIDHDKFDPSNITRVYGSYPENSDELKTSIISRNIKKIQPKAVITQISTKLQTEDDARVLCDCDLVFSCTDKHTPRSFLNNFAYQYFIPVIDVGVGIDSENEMITGGNIRATLLSPTLPCLQCLGIIDPDTIYAESMSTAERHALEKEGYVNRLDDDVPAVIPFTTMAASMGILLMKNMLFGIIKTSTNTLSLDITTFQSSKLRTKSKPDCVCLARMGVGDNTEGRR